VRPPVQKIVAWQDRRWGVTRLSHPEKLLLLPLNKKALFHKTELSIYKAERIIYFV
jgi:hypothetical protein